MSESLRVRPWAFVLVCATAGALAVPPHAVASPFSATLAALVGFVGLRLWGWLRLPASIRAGTSRGNQRFVQLAMAMGPGLVIGLLVLATIRLVIEPNVRQAGARIAAAGALPLWRRAAIVYVAAVGW